MKMMRFPLPPRPRTTFILALLLPVPPLAGEEWIILGPKAMGMGGAGVASVRGGYGMYWNPATLAQPYLRKPIVYLETKDPEKEPERIVDIPAFDLEVTASAVNAATGEVLPKISLVGDLVERINFTTMRRK